MLKWEQDSAEQHRARLGRVAKGQGPLLPGTNLYDGSWVPSGPLDPGPPVAAMIRYIPNARILKFKHEAMIRDEVRRLLESPEMCHIT